MSFETFRRTLHDLDFSEIEGIREGFGSWRPRSSVAPQYQLYKLAAYIYFRRTARGARSWASRIAAGEVRAPEAC